MSIQVLIPTPLRKHTSGAEQISCSAIYVTSRGSCGDS